MSSVFGLKATPEEGDLLADQRAEVLLELADRAPLLELVDLDDGGEQLEVVAGVAGELLERLDVFWETVVRDEPPVVTNVARSGPPASSTGPRRAAMTSTRRAPMPGGTHCR